MSIHGKTRELKVRVQKREGNILLTEHVYVDQVGWVRLPPPTDIDDRDAVFRYAMSGQVVPGYAFVWVREGDTGE